MKRRIRVLTAFVLACCLLLSGCFGGREKQGLLSVYKMGNPVSARFYTSFAEEGKQVEELDSSKLPELTERLQSMHYKTHAFHTDYYWGGKFGVELTLDDGTYWSYDGTLVKHSSRSLVDREAEERVLGRSFVEVTDCDFWSVMQEFFPSIDRNMIMGGW